MAIDDPVTLINWRKDWSNIIEWGCRAKACYEDDAIEKIILNGDEIDCATTKLQIWALATGRNGYIKVNLLDEKGMVQLDKSGEDILTETIHGEVDIKFKGEK